MAVMQEVRSGLNTNLFQVNLSILTAAGNLILSSLASLSHLSLFAHSSQTQLNSHILKLNRLSFLPILNAPFTSHYSISPQPLEESSITAASLQFSHLLCLPLEFVLRIKTTQVG
jgi:hypothetical protein